MLHASKPRRLGSEEVGKWGSGEVGTGVGTGMCVGCGVWQKGSAHFWQMQPGPWG
jgi:hypothetical protein